jgi:hypothetical protein
MGTQHLFVALTGAQLSLFASMGANSIICTNKRQAYHHPCQWGPSLLPFAKPMPYFEVND